MAVANNADDYAGARQGIFFPGVNPTLDGQCVSLVKYFLQDMTEVLDPQAARGDARYMGKTLVAQGYADEVPYADRRRGDIVCLEYGTYGHIYVQLSGGQVFEENVNWPGVASKIVDGSRVYASRIGSDSEGWRHDMHVYRIKSYNEGGTNMPTITNDDLTNLGYEGVLHEKPQTPDIYDHYRGQKFEDTIREMRASGRWQEIDNALVDNAVYIDRFNKLGAIVGLDVNKDGLDAIVAKVQQEHDVADNPPTPSPTPTPPPVPDPNNVVITPGGWAALWNTIKAFFSKNK